MGTPYTLSVVLASLVRSRSGVFLQLSLEYSKSGSTAHPQVGFKPTGRSMPTRQRTSVRSAVSSMSLPLATFQLRKSVQSANSNSHLQSREDRVRILTSVRMVTDPGLIVIENTEAFAGWRLFAAEPRILEVRIESTPTSRFTPTGRSVPTRQRTSVEVGCVLNAATISDVPAAQVGPLRTRTPIHRVEKTEPGFSPAFV